MMLNSVLNSIPIYYLSFMKMSAKVRKEVIGIQRAFLWGGNLGCKKITWIRWVDVCKQRELRGLGVKNIFIFNLSLLGKWRWRLLVDKEALWCVIRAKYGDEVCANPNAGLAGFHKLA